MEGRKASIRTRKKLRLRPGQFVCGNVFHSDWESSDSSPKYTNVRASVLDVLSAIGGRRVSAICRDCRHAADRRPEVVHHSLYSLVSAIAGFLFFASAGIRCVELDLLVVRLQPRRAQCRPLLRKKRTDVSFPALVVPFYFLFYPPLSHLLLHILLCLSFSSPVLFLCRSK